MAAAGGRRSEGREGAARRLKVASAVNNFFRRNTQRPLPCALPAMPSNYSPRPPVIIPITSRTEESVTQHARQGEGKATERWINISFTHPALPSRAGIKLASRGRRRRGEREGGRGRGKEEDKKRGPPKATTRGLEFPLSFGRRMEGSSGPGDGAAGGPGVNV